MDIISKSKILYDQIGSFIGYQGRIIFLGLIGGLEKSREAVKTLTKEREGLRGELKTFSSITRMNIKNLNDEIKDLKQKLTDSEARVKKIKETVREAQRLFHGNDVDNDGWQDGQEKLDEIKQI